MNEVDEFARLKSEIRRLQDRADVLRAGFLEPGARLRSNLYEVAIRRTSRRYFVKERLPDTILRDPRYWDVRDGETVTCTEIMDDHPEEEEVVLIE